MIGKKDDWFEKQIDIIAKTIVGILFGRERLTQVLLDQEEESDVQTKANEEFLACVIERLLHERKINEAEDLLFEEIEKSPTPKKLEIASKFYDALDKLDEKILIENDYSKDEITESIELLKKIYLAK